MITTDDFDPENEIDFLDDAIDETDYKWYEGIEKERCKIPFDNLLMCAPSSKTKGHCFKEYPTGSIYGYFRYRYRLTEAGKHICLDIATILCWPFRAGLFRQLFNELKEDNRICCIKVESIHSAVLWDCLPRYGFELFPGDDLSMVFCKEKKS